MIFRCYAVMGTSLVSQMPIKYCIVGDGKLFIDSTFNNCKYDVLDEYPDAEFIDDCGWVFVGEEDKLLDLTVQMMIEENHNAKRPPKEEPDDPGYY